MKPKQHHLITRTEKSLSGVKTELLLLLQRTHDERVSFEFIYVRETLIIFLAERIVFRQWMVISKDVMIVDMTRATKS
ncbi:hypothetical protein EYB33_15610 [Lysinibacillus sphaericus]|uniref:hypothetical protein n=2 Tax=Lysinibacillus sphaericus TaxID=1421 RepID=UPI001E42F4A6|nr:hypothetical protein [Lysinibacillus sphaericus]UDK97646.1 hypothetical protein EYB33_15610 [Lysinibacillus sphaericus]